MQQEDCLLVRAWLFGRQQQGLPAAVTATSQTHGERPPIATGPRACAFRARRVINDFCRSDALNPSAVRRIYSAVMVMGRYRCFTTATFALWIRFRLGRVRFQRPTRYDNNLFAITYAGSSEVDNKEDKKINKNTGVQKAKNTEKGIAQFVKNISDNIMVTIYVH